jgi:ornithine cyclodeaminase
MAAADELLVLDRAMVERCLVGVDVLELVADTLKSHYRGLTELPDEGYLTWTNQEGAYSRSVAMPGAVRQPDRHLYGLKLINAATSNPARSIDRAGGFAFLFDSETARPRLMAEAGLLSALRTAACTVVALRELGPREPSSAAILGCGALARMHLRLLAATTPSLDTAHVYDLVPQRAAGFGEWARDHAAGIRVVVADHAADCVARSEVLITVTISSAPYIPLSWFTAPSFIAHVSLDDLLPETFAGAAAIFVDDENMVAANPRRILGQLMTNGQIGRSGSAQSPRITGSLGEVLDGAVQGVRPGAGHVISNPFGLAILDVALLGAVEEAARRDGEGIRMNLVDGFDLLRPIADS